MTVPTKTKTDLLIIGGGPAGLSTATFFARVNRPFILYDSGLYRNAQTPTAHTIMRYENVSPAFYRNQVRAQLEAAYGQGKDSLGNGQFRKGKIVSLRVGATAEDGVAGFEAVDEDGQTITARKVVLATGIKNILPDIPGELHVLLVHIVTTQNSSYDCILNLTQESKKLGDKEWSTVSSVTVPRLITNHSHISSHLTIRLISILPQLYSNYGTP